MHVCDSIDDRVLKGLGCSFGISLMVVTAISSPPWESRAWRTESPGSSIV